MSLSNINTNLKQGATTIQSKVVSSESKNTFVQCISNSVEKHVIDDIVTDMDDLDSFLNFFRVNTKNSEDSSVPILSTHTGIGKNMGSYNVPDEYSGKLFQIMRETFTNGESFHLIERPPDRFSRMKWDFDFKYPIKRNDSEEILFPRYHTFSQIQQIVRLINQEIKEFLDVENKDLTCFVFERDSPYCTEKHMKDGFHLMYPTIVSKPEIQYAIRESIINKKIIPIVESLGYVNAISDVVDRLVIDKNGWYVYGSSKPGLEPYLLTHVLDQNGEEMDKEKDVVYPDYCLDEQEDIDLQRLFSIRIGLDDHEKYCKEEKSSIVQKSTEKRVSLIKKKANASHGVQNLQKYDIPTVRKYLDCLSLDRWSTYPYWRDIIYVLHNIDPSCQELVDIAKEYSKKIGEKYEEGCVERLWNGAKNDGTLTYGSLIYWSKNDNMEKYLEIHMEQLKSYIENSISGTNVDIANTLFQLFKDQFKCVSSRNSVWYEFKEHRWVEVDGNVSIRIKISTDLFDVYQLRFESLSEELALTESEENHEKIMKKIKAITDIMTKLKNSSFKDNIMKECKDLFHDSEFYKKLDENIYLVGFKNGVLDLRTLEFRDGRPDDYITKSTVINYLYEDEMDDTIVEQIRDFLSDIYGSDEMVEYMICMFASCLFGMNKEEKFRINTGSGGNGKSKITDLLFLAFGDYIKKLPITLITRKRADSTIAQPALLELKGCRLGFFEETEEKESFNVGIVKEMSGNDNITARGLYDKNIIKFKNQAKLFVNCNDLPKVPPYDEGMWRRLEVIEYKRKFIDNPDPNNPLEKKKDIHLLEKIKYWPETFMAMLVHRGFRNYNSKGLRVPFEIVQFTNRYKDDCDNFREFLDELVIYTGKAEHICSIDQMYEEFRYWFTTSMSGRTIPIRKDFGNYLKKRLGKQKIGGPGNKFIVGYTYHDGTYTILDENDIIIQHATPKFIAGATPGSINKQHHYDSATSTPHTNSFSKIVETPAIATPSSKYSSIASSPTSGPSSIVKSPGIITSNKNIPNPNTKFIHLKKTKSNESEKKNIDKF